MRPAMIRHFMTFGDHTAHDLGMRIHFDIGSSFSEVSEASLEGWITRYRGLVESYQFANENYAIFESDMAEGNPASFERFDRLLGLGRSAARWRVVERPIKQVWDTGPPQKRVDVARLARLHVTSNMQNAPSPAAVTKPTL